jgi:hypothetical protein
VRSSFTLDDGRIRLGDAVFVYLERTVAPRAPLPAREAPRAYGVTPAEVSPSGSVVAAVAPGEAVWLGFQAVDPARPASVRVRLDLPEQLDAITGGPWKKRRTDNPRNYLVCPPDSRLAGVRRDRASLPFSLDRKAVGSELVEAFSVLAEGNEPALVHVELVAPETFAQLTGIIPAPLDPDHAYGGWRLP